MAPMKKKGIVEETEVQRIAREGFERLAEKKYDDVCAVILGLIEEGSVMDDAEKRAYEVYAGLLAHCLLCWQPQMREILTDTDKKAASRLIGMEDADQEEFFVFSQRLEDYFNDDMVAGLGVYLHALLLLATNDKQHEANVLSEAEKMKEPMSSMQLAEEALEREKFDDAQRFLQIAIAAEHPCAIEIAHKSIQKGVFSDVVCKELRNMISSSKYEIKDSCVALKERDEFLAASVAATVAAAESAAAAAAAAASTTADSEEKDRDTSDLSDSGIEVFSHSGTEDEDEDDGGDDDFDPSEDGDDSMYEEDESEEDYGDDDM